MEQARYWMWAKRKPDSNIVTAPMNPFGDSWEEQAFAEDAAGTLGGCVWPPRSYSCSFCRREFRSAQALGGHMNVHRRDRARLKQSSSSDQNIVPQNHHALITPSDHQICTFLYNNNNNPNSEFSDARVLSSSPVTKLNREEKMTTTLCFLSPIVHKNDVVSMDLNPPPSWSSFVAAGKRDRGHLDSNKIDEPDGYKGEKEDCVTEVVCGTRASSDEEVGSYKRRRVEEKPLSSRCFSQSEVLKICSNSTEELDLELRLGNAPKVK